MSLSKDEPAEGRGRRAAEGNHSMLGYAIRRLLLAALITVVAVTILFIILAIGGFVSEYT